MNSSFLLAVILVAATLPACVVSICCNGGTCASGHPGLCCGRGPCNIFCCNCDDGCLPPPSCQESCESDHTECLDSFSDRCIEWGHANCGGLMKACEDRKTSCLSQCPSHPVPGPPSHKPTLLAVALSPAAAEQRRAMHVLRAHWVWRGCTEAGTLFPGVDEARTISWLKGWPKTMSATFADIDWVAANVAHPEWCGGQRAAADSATPCSSDSSANVARPCKDSNGRTRLLSTDGRRPFFPLSFIGPAATGALFFEDAWQLMTKGVWLGLGREMGRSLFGVLKSVGQHCWDKYITTYGNDWLSASAQAPAGATKFQLNARPGGTVIVAHPEADSSGVVTMHYLSHKELSGAGGLFAGSNEQTALNFVDDNQFTLYYPNHEEYLGTWDDTTGGGTGDNELYVRDDNKCRNFQFYYLKNP